MSMRRRLLLLAVSLIAATCAPRPAAQAALTTTRIASGLLYPVYVTGAPNNSRLYIVEQRGVIKIYSGGAVQPTPFFDIDSLVIDPSQFEERGLLGLAFHPDYPDSAYIFVDYVNNANQTVIARYPILGANSDSVDASKPRVILTINQPYGNHKGGTLLFGPDRYLYIGMGDGGSGGDPENRAQNPQVLLGKILRIDPLGGVPYAIPPDNPFLFDPNYRPEIWAMGVRNPYRWSFDRQTGDMWIGEVGQNDYEEVDFAPAGVGGQNYGWRLMEATHCFNPTSGCEPDTLDGPIHEYDHGQGCSITGGIVYRGSAIPEIQGHYFYADYCSGKIWSFKYNGVAVTDSTDRTVEMAPGGGLGIGSIVCIGQDGYGEMYFVDRGTGANGEVYWVVPSSTEVVPTPRTAVQLGPLRPNPFSASTSFSVTLSRAGRLEIDVTDTRGRRVSQLVSEHRDPGVYPFEWSGKDTGGRQAASGVYYLRVRLDGKGETRAMTLTR
jgi:glucose/arabinose dehydrogenase